MPEPSFGPLRLWERAPTTLPRGPSPPGSAAGIPTTAANPPEEDLRPLHLLAEDLARQEILRSLPGHRDHVEPLTLQWYLELEHLRHQRQGKWIPTLLEFGKHQGERLLGLGVGLGSDLVQYARNGTEVLAASPSADQLALVRRNFELRGLPALYLHSSPATLPVESSSIDVVCLSGLLHEAGSPGPLIDEVYRVLKPGGKVLAVVPAYFDINHWLRMVWLGSVQPTCPPSGEVPPLPAGLLSPEARRYRGSELRQLFHRFHETRVYKRHLRRGDVPHVWRWLPLSLLERVAGRLLVFKAFKPVSAARYEQAAA